MKLDKLEALKDEWLQKYANTVNAITIVAIRTGSNLLETTTDKRLARDARYHYREWRQLIIDNVTVIVAIHSGNKYLTASGDYSHTITTKITVGEKDKIVLVASYVNTNNPNDKHKTDGNFIVPGEWLKPVTNIVEHENELGKSMMIAKNKEQIKALERILLIGQPGFGTDYKE